MCIRDRGVPGLKNLIFQNRNRSRTLFLLLPREKRLDAKALAKSRNITRLSMVNAAALEDLLHTHAGAVGAMELMYDMEGKLELFIDREVLDGPFVRFPPNADGRLVRIATSDFVDKLLPAIKHGYTAVSYTHLDVYKRQHHHRNGIHSDPGGLHSGEVLDGSLQPPCGTADPFRHPGSHRR